MASEGLLPIATAPVDDPPTPPRVHARARTHTHAHTRSLTHTPAALRHRLTSRSARPAPSLPPARPACALRWDHVGGGGGRGSGSVSGPARSEQAAGLQGASQCPQRLRCRLLLPLLLASFTLPAAARPFTPRAGRAAPGAAPRLPPRARAGVPDRAGALAGSWLRAAAAQDQEAAVPTGRRW